MIAIKKLIPTVLFAVFIANRLCGAAEEDYIKNILQADRGVIHLIGEFHNDPADIKRKAILKKLAKEGKIILGLEGVLQEAGTDLNATLFGLEEETINSLAVSINCLMHVLRHVGYRKTVALDSNEKGDAYSELFASPDYEMLLALKSIWAYIKAAIVANKDGEEIDFYRNQLQSNGVLVGMLTRLQKDVKAIEPSASIYAENIGSNQLEDNFYDNLSLAPHAGDWFVLLQRVVRYNIRRQDTFSGEDLEVFSDLQSLYTALIEVNNTLGLKLIEHQIGYLVILSELLTMDLRNEIFLQNILQAYQSKSHLNKPFFVIVGVNHVPFLKESLEKQDFEVVQRRSHDFYSEHAPSPRVDL